MLVEVVVQFVTNQQKFKSDHKLGRANLIVLIAIKKSQKRERNYDYSHYISKSGSGFSS